MDYLQRIIHEEIKKKLNEGFFDIFKGENDRNSEEESRQRIENALQNFRQSLINVCGNLLRYGQTVRDPKSVKMAGYLEKYANKYISSIGGYIYSIGKQEGDTLIPDSDYEDEAGTVGNIPNPPQDSDRRQNTEQEPQPQRDYDDPYYRGYSPPDPINAPENDVQEELPEEEDGISIEFVEQPTLIRRGKSEVAVFYEGSEDPSENSIYKIFASNEKFDEGEFELIDNPIVRYLVSTLPNDYFFPCCEGSVPKTLPTEIATTKRGTVHYDGVKSIWEVKNKAEVVFKS